MTDTDPWYDDGRIRLDADGIRIARYYFPTGRPRVVSWSDLRGYEALPMTARTGRYRVWGTGRLDRWFACDVTRSRKSEMLVLDVTGIRPVLTPDDVPAVRALLDRQFAR